MKTKNRIIWIDNLKAVALILIVIGHLWQSFTKSAILPDDQIFNTFNRVIYYFHVELFFIASGYLYQKLNKKQSFKDYTKLIGNKLIAFGVPFIVFLSASYLLKVVFASEVNSQADGLFYSFFIVPLAPYWFLYALFFIFAVSPILKGKADGIIRIIIAFALYFVSFINLSFLPAPLVTIIKYISLHLIWFVLGMEIARFDMEKLFKKWHIVFFIIGCAIGITLCLTKKATEYNLLVGMLCCVGLVSFTGAVSKSDSQNKLLGLISKYNMPIFLMHTIFAAGLRAVLFKIGITNPLIHIPCGLIASFAMPILAMEILQKIKCDFIVYPTKYFKIK